MSTTHSNPATSTFLLFSIILLCFPSIARTDDPCPYPCYPPPTGTGIPTTPSGTTALPAPPAPPQPGSTYPQPSGYNPYNPTPPYGGGEGSGSGSGGGGGGGVFGTPPPPEPILPYFPFYYRKPPHKPEDASASTTLQKWTGMIATTSLFSLLLLFV